MLLPPLRSQGSCPCLKIVLRIALGVKSRGGLARCGLAVDESGGKDLVQYTEIERRVRAETEKAGLDPDYEGPLDNGADVLPQTGMGGTRVDPDRLVACAFEGRENAYAPYSKFKVGAALLARSGTVYTGCNVENATYGLTVRAERVPLWKAISEGERDFTRIAVVVESERLAPPAGPAANCCGNFPATSK